jgi:hypothetical protein
MVALAQRWEERTFALAGRADGIDIHVVTFVNRPASIGRVEIAGTTTIREAAYPGNHPARQRERNSAYVHVVGGRDAG